MRDRHGRELWRWEGLRPDGADSLNLGLSTALLAPGDYGCTVEAVGARPSSSLRFPFLPPG